MKRTIQRLWSPRLFPVVLVAALLLALWAAGTAGADRRPSPLRQGSTPQMVNYQGIVKVNNNPYDGTGYFKFAIADASTGDGTTNYWANDGTASGEPGTSVPLTVDQGQFNVLLGDTSLTGMTQSIEPSDVNHDPTYLRVWFSQTGAGGSFEALGPNQRLASVPYALLAPDHDHFGEAWSGSSAIGLRVNNSTTNGHALFGYATASTGQTNGVRGRSDSTQGKGVRGLATAPTGTTYGVYGRSESTDGTGVYGYASASTGNTYGVYGRSDSDWGMGVYGYAADGYAVRGETDGFGGTGVYGWAAASTGDTYGVYGRSESDQGIGVCGGALALTGTTYGVHGWSDSTDGAGVHGAAWAQSGTTYGVYGVAKSDHGYGGFFVNTSGNLLAANDWWTTSDLEFKVDNDGDVYADRAYYCGLGSGCFNSGTGADVAERIDAIQTLEPGDVVEIDPDHAGLFRLATTPFSSAVAGVVSSNPAVTMGNSFDPEDDNWNDDRPLLALVGIVVVKASAENGPIAPGDLLVAAATRGHAMRGGPNPPIGTVIGKALEPLDQGTGLIQMLVMLQ